MEDHSPRSSHKGQYYSDAHDIGNSGTGTVNINWDEGNYQFITLTGNITFTFSNLQAGGRYLLEIRTGAGGFTVVWPTITWLREAGAAPIIPTAASKTAVLGLSSSDGALVISSYGDNA